MALFHFRKLYISFLLLSGPALLGTDVLAKFPPPPPSISSINQYGWQRRSIGGPSSWENIREIVRLYGDTVLEGYRSWNGGFDLNGYKLTIGAGGVNIYSNVDFPRIYGLGSITSSAGSLNFNLYNSTGITGYVISSKITNHETHEIGLRVSGGASGHNSHVDLTGNESNTFSGDVYISNQGGLQLYKTNSAISVLGNVHVSDEGYLLLSGSNQISDSSKIRLDGRSRIAFLYFGNYYNSIITEKVHALEVKGSGVLDYSHYLARYDHVYDHLYLDDLEVSADSKLTIKNWQLGRDHLLVRKGSEHLIDSLNRIKFEGHWEWKAGLKDYSRDYWQIIPGIPELSTYEAVFTSGILGFAFCQRRRTPHKSRRYA